MASDKAFNYLSAGLWLLLTRNSENDGIKDSEVDNRFEKHILLTFSKDAKSFAGFSPSRQSRVGQNDVT